MVVAIVIGCEKQHEEPVNVPEVGLGCLGISGFLDGVSAYAPNTEFYEESYLVKGVVLDKIEYGVRVKLLEDLKGNFDKTGNDVFTVWGDGNSFIESNRLEKLNLCNTGDTLIMHITHSPDWPYEVPPGHVWFEKPEDYCTFVCSQSVLKILDGYVTRHDINGEELARIEEELARLEETDYTPEKPVYTPEESDYTPNIEIVSLTENDKAILDEYLSKYTVFTMDLKELTEYFNSNGGKGRVRLQINEDLDWLIELESDDPRYEYTCKGTTSDGKHVRFGFNENIFLGAIFGEYHHYVIESTNDFTRNKDDKSLIVYNNVDFIYEQHEYINKMPLTEFENKLNELLN
jgi:hypothetical protein